MQFFTPDILIRGNSPDDAVNEAADDDWDVATAAYEARLAELSDRLPVDVRELADVYLHDGEVLMWGDPRRPPRSIKAGRRLAGFPPGPNQSLVAVRLDDVVTSIEYDLSGPVRASSRRREQPFAAQDHVEWLYDEVDTSPTSAGTFLHRVLLGDGREVEVPFTSVRIRRVPLSPPSPQRIAPAKRRVRRTA